MSQLLSYAGITILACIGYGAFFLVVGLFFRNPIIPAIVLYGWEWLNFLLPLHNPNVLIGPPSVLNPWLVILTVQSELDIQSSS